MLLDNRLRLNVAALQADYNDIQVNIRSNPANPSNTDVLNARLALSETPISQGILRVALWGKNLEDKQYYTDHNNAVVPYAIFRDPRSYGLGIVYEYR